MKITIYELLGMVKDGKAPKKIKYKDRTYTLYLDEENNRYYQDDKCKYFMLSISCFEDLNDEVEILEEEPKVQVELTEKEYLDKISEYMESVRNYIPKPSFLKLEEEKKIPEKLEEPRFNKGRYYIKDINGDDTEITGIERTLRLKINEIIDYLKSKGDE